MPAPSTLEAMRREQLLHDNAERMHECLVSLLGVLQHTNRRLASRGIPNQEVTASIIYAEHTLSRAEGRNPLK